jgi:hypothetical protein
LLVIEAKFIKQSFQSSSVAVLVGNRKIIFALARHAVPGLLKKTNDIGAVLNPSGFKFAAKRRVKGGEQLFPALAEFSGNLNRALTCGVIGAAQAVFDVDHPLPGVKKIVVAAVVINRDVPAGAEIGFDGGNVVVGAHGLGRGMNLVRMTNRQNIQRVLLQPAAQQMAEVIEDGRFRFGGDIFLKAQDDAAVFLGKMRAVNQPLCDGWVAMQNPRGGIFQLVADGRLFAAKNLDYHNASIAARIAASSTIILTASIFSPVRTARLMPRAT